MFAKFIPKCLNVDRKRSRVKALLSICARLDENADFLNRILAMNES